MRQIVRTWIPALRPLVRVASGVAILSVGLACSNEPPMQAGSPTSAPHEVNPFATLTDPSGCVIERLTSAEYDEYQVSGASWDGSLLALATRMEGPSEEEPIERVYELDLETGQMTQMPPFLTNSGAYSPDGRFQVVAQLADDGKTDIFEYERATGELRAVAPHEAWEWVPSYSSDGRFILFNSYRVDGQSDIHLYERETGTLRRITEDPAYDARADFAPDGNRIAFHRQRGRREEGGYIFDLFVHDLETGRETQLTGGEYEESYPSWAPDSRHLVYSSDIAGRPEKLNLYVLDPEGNDLVRLTEGDWKDNYAFWTRDGAFIYFNSDRDGVTNVYRLPMDGLDCVRE